MLLTNPNRLLAILRMPNSPKKNLKYTYEQLLLAFTCDISLGYTDENREIKTVNHIYILY